MPHPSWNVETIPLFFFFLLSFFLLSIGALCATAACPCHWNWWSAISLPLACIGWYSSCYWSQRTWRALPTPFLFIFSLDLVPTTFPVTYNSLSLLIQCSFPRVQYDRFPSLSLSRTSICIRYTTLCVNYRCGRYFAPSTTHPLRPLPSQNTTKKLKTIYTHLSSISVCRKESAALTVDWARKWASKPSHRRLWGHSCHNAHGMWRDETSKNRRALHQRCASAYLKQCSVARLAASNYWLSWEVGGGRNRGA